jgi:hypothetical protein
MNSIKAAASGVVRVLVINPNLVFACKHATNAFANSIALSKDERQYPVTPQWHRFEKKDGQIIEEDQATFTVRDTIQAFPGDGVFFQTYRSLPVEAAETIARPNIGDTVLVESMTQKTVVQAKVTAVNPGTGYISTDYKAQQGDSNSLVTDASGNAVGFVSAQILSADGTQSVGSRIVVPETGIAVVPGNTVVAPNPNQPQPGTTAPTLPVTPVVTPPYAPTLPSVSFAEGVAFGKKSLAIELSPKLAEVQSLLAAFISK